MNSQQSDARKEAIVKDIAKLNSRIHDRTKRNSADLGTISQLTRESHRLTILALVGIPDGVCVRYRNACLDQRLDDATGTVLHVRRTRATVDFGELGKWQFAIESLLPTAERANQGWFVFTGAHNRG